MSSFGSLQCIIYAKVFQSDRILGSTNGFTFQIISSLIESMRECLTWPDCNDLIFCCLFVLFCFSHGAVLKSTLCLVPLKTVLSCLELLFFPSQTSSSRELYLEAGHTHTQYIWTLSSVVVLLLLLTVGTESGNASRSLTDRFNGPGMEKLQETSSGLAGVVARNKQVRFCETLCYWLKIK